MMRRKKILLSAGGTGGHLFPAQVLAEALSEKYDLLFVGAKLCQNRFFNREKFSFKEIPASSLSLSPKKIINIFSGIWESRKILNEFQPDLIIGFGSYYTFPLLMSSLLKKIPIMLHEQNALPGRVNRLFSPFAKITAVSFPKTCELLKGKHVVEVSFPLRKKTLENDPWDYFGLDRGKKILLVFGGSQGAKALNHLFMEVASSLPAGMQILHFTGDKEITAIASSFYKKLGLKACVKEFEEKMGNALTISDYALTRAGASTIAELIEWEKPAILIPFPFAKDNHQVMNGNHFVEEVGGGQLLLQEEAASYLKDALARLFLESSENKKNIQKYKQKKQLKAFSELIIDYLED